MTRRQLPHDPKDRALLDAVLAAPDDDAPRLVYADRLTERGEPQGELIVVQCTRKQLEARGDVTTDAYHRVRLRERELLPPIRAHWEKSFGGEAGFAIGRGFVTQATLSCADLRRRWSLWRAHPLETLSLTAAYGNWLAPHSASAPGSRGSQRCADCAS